MSRCSGGDSRETFELIRIPSHVAGGPVSVLSFYISNEEGETINTMGERFEAVIAPLRLK
jgi:hypothetical protein